MLHYRNTIQKIYIELTEHCNLNCPSCFRVNWAKEPSHMSNDIFNKTLDSVAKANTVVIGGIGEPTAHPKFNQYSELLAQRGFVDRRSHTPLTIQVPGAEKSLELTSNAYFWPKDTLDTIVSLYKKVTVSVDGLPEFFKRARGFDFEIMAENIRSLAAKKKETRSKYPVIHAQLVLSDGNMHDVKELIPILKELGFQRLVISNLLPQCEGDKDNIVYTPYLTKELRDFVNSWYPIASGCQLPIKIPQTKLNFEHRCVFIEDGALIITANGDVAPCYRFAHDGVEYVFGRKKTVRAFYFGNVLEASLQDIWDRKDYEIFRFQNYASRYPSCVDCDYVEFCDYINSTEADCRANEPSCADCLWCRGLIECP